MKSTPYRLFITVSILLIGIIFSLIKNERKPIEIHFSPPAWENAYLKSTNSFGALQIGDHIPIGGPGDRTSNPIKIIPQSKFYVYVHRMGLPTFCILEECSFFDGSIVKCMGGWLSGDEQPETSDRVGLNSEEVWNGNTSIVIVADEKGKMTGVYPQHTEGDVAAILAGSPEYREDLLACMRKGVTLKDEED